METFTYSVFWKFIYRYGNFVITPLLLLYILPIALNLDKNLILIVPFIIALFLFYYINKAYFNFYKLVPNKIEIDDEKIICSEFLFKDKMVMILFEDIKSLSGGIFNGRFRGLMKVCDGKNKICIGFFDRINNSTKLITIILSKVDKTIYDQTIKNIQSLKIKPELKK